MVPKVTTGASIRSSLEYDLASKKGEQGGEWVAGSLVGTAREMAAQATIYRQLRPDCKKAIWSCSLSLPPADGRRSAENWAEITQSFFKKMDINPSKYAWAAHRHTHENDHIHIRLCRVGSDGVLWNQEHSARRAIKASAELEVEFDLNKHDRTPKPKDHPSRAEIEISNRKKRKGTTIMSREIIQDSVNKLLKNHPHGINFNDFQKLLAADGIDVQAYAPSGELKGVSYHCDSFKWPGSKIGRDYSAGLTARGVRYTPDSAKSNLAEEMPAGERVEVLPVEEVKEPAAPLKMRSDEDVEDVEDRRAPAPASARQIPWRTESPKEMAERARREHQKYGWLPASRAREEKSAPAVEVKQTADAARSRLIKLLINLSVDLAGVLADLAKAVMAFLRKLLAFFGFRVAENALQNQEQPPEVRPALELFELKPERPDDEETRLENAVVAVAALTQAVRKNDPLLLPNVDCAEKEELKTLMLAGPEQVKQATGLDDLGLDSVDFSTEPMAALEVSSAPLEDPIISLKQSGAEYIEAFKKVKEARQPVDTRLMDFTPSMKERLAGAVLIERDAQDALAHLLKTHPVAAIVWGNEEFDQRKRLQSALTAAQLELGAAGAVLHAHQNDLAAAQRAHYLKPMRTPPAALTEALESALTAFKAGQSALATALRANLTAVKNPQLLAQLRKDLNSSFGSGFAQVEREGSAEALAALLANMQAVRRRAQAEAIQLAAPRPTDKPVVDGDDDK